MEDSVNDSSACSLDFKRLLDCSLTSKRRIEYMGSAVRSVNNSRSSINTVSNIADLDTDSHIMIKDFQGSYTKLE